MLGLDFSPLIKVFQSKKGISLSQMKQNGQLLGVGHIDIVATGYYTPDVKRGICKKIRLTHVFLL